MSQRFGEQFSTMSPTGKFAVGVLGVTVLLLVWSEVFMPMANGWGDQADAIEENLVLIEDAGGGSLSTRNAVLAHGPVELPDSREEGSQSLIETIKSTMATWGITDYTLNESGSGVTVRGLTGGRVERIKADLAFTGEVETAHELIADLEMNPAIESIESLRLTRGKRSGTLDVTATVEAWVNAGSRRR
ncbi:MAG: hypothetical protein MK101_09165 [Phycisphaerales bacterium]|nr:hypothetical protein [Phycisphaerales bacterium]